MKLKDLTRKDIQRIAQSPEIYSRGVQYYEDRMVSNLSLTPQGITARVQGSYGLYTVKIEADFDDPDELEMECNCPYDGYPCKHMIAVLLQYVQGNYSQMEPMVETGLPKAMVQALEELSREKLLKLVIRLAEEEGDFRRVLMANLKISPQILNRQPENPTQVKKLKQAISQFFNQLQHRLEYGDYYSGYEYEYDENERYSELDSTFEIIQGLNPADQLEVLWHLLSTGADAFDDEAPIATVQLEEAFGLYAQAVKSLRLSPRQNLPYLEALHKALDWDIFEYGAIAQAMKNGFETICTTAEDYAHVGSPGTELEFAL